MKKLSLMAVLFSLVSSASFASTITCGGTEPFWNVKVANGNIVFSDPATDKTYTLKVTGQMEAVGYGEGSVMAISSKYTSLTMIKAEGCSDGMSDQTYSYYATYSANGVLFGGCCNAE